jgi:hypothetical protein
MGIPLLAGRDFNSHDNEQEPRVALVNQAFARQIMQMPNPIGKAFRYGPNAPPIRIIGLVPDGKYVSLTEEPRPAIFLSALQRYDSTTTIVVKSSLPASLRWTRGCRSMEQEASRICWDLRCFPCTPPPWR